MATDDENKPVIAPDEPKTEPEEHTVEQPAIHAKVVVSEEKGIKKIWHKYLAKKKLTIPLTILVLALLIMAIPSTRFTVLGLFIKQQIGVKVVDSSTGSPITKANVSIAGKTAVTDNQGRAVFTIKVGQQQLEVTKKYYASYSQKVMVPISKPKQDFKVQLKATGRQVPIAVTNKISGAAVENATITASGSEAKTDSQGKAIIVLPADKTSVDGALSANGYNDSKITITITEQSSDKNNFTVTPTGKIYFLSKASGKIDVVKTNLDGTERKTVLAGTGKESETDTVLLASRDWKYLALKSKRDGKNEKLYLITTADDKLTTMDEGSATFDMIGWQNNYFVYQVNRNNPNYWQPKNNILKSYNGQNKNLITLDSSNAIGNEFDPRYESIYGSYLFDGQLVYSKNWNSYYGNELSNSLQNSLNSINPDGSGKKVIYKIGAGTASIGSKTQYEIDELAIEVDYLTSTDAPIYIYGTDGSFKKDTTLDSAIFSKTYPTYLQSPSAKMAFWFEARDGKQSLFTSKPDGSDKKTIGSLTEYKTYGWYSDDYLLVSKNSSELYIMPNAVMGNKKPVKISDYHKPAQDFYGYGGGYGGI